MKKTNAIDPPLPSRDRTRAEHLCLAAIALMLVVWALMPSLAQDPTYHRFADQRPWLGIPHAADVVSNLAFALVGVLAAGRLAAHRRPQFSPATEAGLWCISLGLVGTAMGSAWYHLDPNDSTLAWDRLPMTLVFAGILGAAVAQRVGANAGRRVLALFVPLGVASVAYWNLTGDLSLYLVLQFGGIGGLLLILLITRNGDDPIPWRWVVAWYVLAKVAETMDGTIWHATGGLIAGHAIKHLLAATAAAAALWPLRARN